jgi:hypothetical protein
LDGRVEEVDLKRVLEDVVTAVVNSATRSGHPGSFGEERLVTAIACEALQRQRLRYVAIHERPYGKHETQGTRDDARADLLVFDRASGRPVWIEFKKLDSGGHGQWVPSRFEPEVLGDIGKMDVVRNAAAATSQDGGHPGLPAGFAFLLLVASEKRKGIITPEKAISTCRRRFAAKCREQSTKKGGGGSPVVCVTRDGPGYSLVALGTVLPRPRVQRRVR